MKSILFLASLFFLISCGNNPGKSQNDKNDSEEIGTEQTNTISATAGCDEFLDDYENWVNEVVEVLNKAKEDPSDVQNTQKVTDATMKLQEWSQRWIQLYDCAGNEKYEKRMIELQEKVEQALQDFYS